MCLPHARGGVSADMAKPLKTNSSSPRTWGCFHVSLFRILDQVVFPTHVGVFLISELLLNIEIGLPHARGGVSRCATRGTTGRRSSPRTWGCFSPSGFTIWSASVFPTHVGVFLSSFADAKLCLGLPHARGGVSRGYQDGALQMRSSPRTWGCFLVAPIV